MRDALSKVLGPAHVDESAIDRILENAFFKERPQQARSSARVIVLAERRQAATRDEW
jgi:hypothetical protein